MLKFIRPVSKCVFIGVILLLFLVEILFSLMQMNFVKNRIARLLSEMAKNEGVLLTLGNIRGNLPFEWVFHDVTIAKDNNSLFMEKMVIRFNLFSLLHKQLEIVKFHTPSCCAFISGEKYCFSLLGKGRFKERGRNFFFEIKGNDLIHPKAYFYAKGEKEKKKEDVRFFVDVQIPSMDVICKSDFDMNAFFHLDLLGPMDAWKRTESPFILSGHLEGTIYSFSYLSSPFNPILNRPWMIRVPIQLTHTSVEMTKCFLQSDLLRMDFEGFLDSSFRPIKASGILSAPDLSLFNPYTPLALDGNLNLDWSYLYPLQTTLSLKTSNLQIESIPIQQFEGSFQAQEKEPDFITGNIHLLASTPSDRLEGQTELEWRIDESLALKDIHLFGSESQLAGNLIYNLSTSLLEGEIFSTLSQLNQWEWLLPHSYLNGKLGLQCSFGKANSLQTFSYYLEAQKLQAYQGFFQNFTSHGQIVDPLNQPEGALAFAIKDGFFNDIHLHSFFFNTTVEKNRYPFYCSFSGEWKTPLSLCTNGIWEGTFSSFRLFLEKFSGSLFSRPYSLEEPLIVEKKEGCFLLSDLKLNLSDGYLMGDIQLRPHHLKGYLKGDLVPLQFLNLLSSNVSLDGFTSFEGEMDADDTHATGRLNAILQEAKIQSYGKNIPFNVGGSLLANLDQKNLQLNIHLQSDHEKMLSCSATLPFSYQLFPFQFSLDHTSSLTGHLYAQTQVEDILDFFNLGTHRLTGEFSGNLFFSNTLEHPIMKGKATFLKGHYENYYTGTNLKHIEAALEAKESELHLDSFKAKDDKGGNLTGSGIFFLQKKEQFPFEFDLHLEKLHALNLDTMTGSFNGDLIIKGDQKSATVIGKVTNDKIHFTIPDKLPVEIPSLPITFVNPYPRFLRKPIPTTTIYPLQLDLLLKANKQIYVRGRGLNSEWEGELNIRGTPTHILAEGSLNLRKGEFLFAGKQFTLTEGHLTFTDKPTPSATLKLSGTLTLQDLTLIATLSGPLSSPQLTFQSIPHLPTSSILSRLLFNKDISEISPFQAIQLAQTIMTLSGKAGPDILEAIRKGLGIDRLTVVSSQDTDAIAVQIGKYITRGVMVTLSQSADSSQVIVEVDLKKGFIFQAETQEDQEGKFSLKWYHNY